MISFATIQNLYNDMYAEIRKYIWDFPTVSALADLEISVYQTCQNMYDIRNKFNRLKLNIFDVYQDDEDLRECVDSFEDAISDDETFVKLNKVNEVVQQ